MDDAATLPSQALLATNGGADVYYPSESESEEEHGADGMNVDVQAPPAAADGDGGD